LWFARFSGCAWPTHSSTPDAPRERVLVELDRDVTRDEGIQIGRVLAADLREAFGDLVLIDPSTFRGEQPVFVPPTGATLARFDGAPLDVDRYLKAAATLLPANGWRGEPPGDPLEAIKTGEGLHDAIGRLVARMAGKGLRRDEIHLAAVGLLENARLARGGRVDEMAGSELDRLIDGALRKYSPRGAHQEDPRVFEAADEPALAQGGPRPAPVPHPLPAELPPVAPFPLAAMPDALRPWAADVADRMQCPADFVAIPLLVGASMLVARRVSIMVQARSDWRERANLWALIVGRPGTMKSPAMAQALAPLERLEARAASAHEAEMETFKVNVLAHKLRNEAGEKTAKGILAKNRDADVREHLSREEPSAPNWPRYLVNDLTYEKLGALLSENPEGVLSVRDEMRGLFLHLAREESAPARAFYLQAWSGGRYTFDRIMRGTVTVKDARLSMVGCIQPGPLSELMQQARRGSSDDGMLDRFLVAWPDTPGDWREVDRWPDTPAKRSAWGVFDRLDLLDAASIGAQVDTDAQGEARGLPFLRFADDAREAFSEWRHGLEATIKAAENESLEAALSKFRHHVPALALVIHVIDGGVGPVTLPSTLRALMLAEYFESHAQRLHGCGHRASVRGAAAILRKARTGALPDPFTARDVYRAQWAGLTERPAVADALDMLTAHGWLAEAATSETGGRKTVIYSLTGGARNE